MGITIVKIRWAKACKTLGRTVPCPQQVLNEYELLVLSILSPSSPQSSFPSQPGLLLWKASSSLCSPGLDSSLSSLIRVFHLSTPPWTYLWNGTENNGVYFMRLLWRLSELIQGLSKDLSDYSVSLLLILIAQRAACKGLWDLGEF